MSSAAGQVRPLLEAVADPSRAPAMAAYMKGIAPYLGVTTPNRRAAARAWVRGFDPGPEAAALLGTSPEVGTPAGRLALIADAVRAGVRP